MCYLQGMSAFHVRQSLREPRALWFWALAALLAAASGCGKITATQPPDAAPGQPDSGALPDAAPDGIRKLTHSQQGSMTAARAPFPTPRPTASSMRRPCRMPYPLRPTPIWDRW